MVSVGFAERGRRGTLVLIRNFRRRAKGSNAIMQIKRPLRYYYYKVVRNRASPESIARGAALGVFLGVAVPPPFQLLAAVPLAYLFRASRPVSLICTFVNPLPVPMYLPVHWVVGSLLLHRAGERWVRKFGLDNLKQIWNELWNHHEISRDLVAFSVGTLLVSTAAAVLAYAVALWAARSYRRNRMRKLAEKRTGDSRVGLSPD